MFECSLESLGHPLHLCLLDKMAGEARPGGRFLAIDDSKILKASDERDAIMRFPTLDPDVVLSRWRSLHEVTEPGLSELAMDLVGEYLDGEMDADQNTRSESPSEMGESLQCAPKLLENRQTVVEAREGIGLREVQAECDVIADIRTHDEQEQEELGNSLCRTGGSCRSGDEQMARHDIPPPDLVCEQTPGRETIRAGHVGREPSGSGVLAGLQTKSKKSRGGRRPASLWTAQEDQELVAWVCRLGGPGDWQELEGKIDRTPGAMKSRLLGLQRAGPFSEILNAAIVEGAHGACARAELGRLPASGGNWVTLCGLWGTQWLANRGRINETRAARGERELPPGPELGEEEYEIGVRK
jgi:hypothetical protein